MDPSDHTQRLPLDRRASNPLTSHYSQRRRPPPLPLNTQPATTRSPPTELHEPSAPINVPHPQPLAMRTSPGSVHDRPVNPPITPHQPHSHTTESSDGRRSAGMNSPLSPHGERMFAMDRHPDQGGGKKYDMPTFRGGPRPGAFAVYDPRTGESNDVGAFAKRGASKGEGGELTDKGKVKDEKDESQKK